MHTYSTCAGCGELFEVTEPRQTTHWHCTAPPVSRVEWLAGEWLAAAEAGDDVEADRIEALIDQIDEAPPRLAAAAAVYASWGWHVFPLRGVGTRCDGDDKCIARGICQCPKKPATRHGFKDATSDADRVYAWWKRWPRSNVGLATGHRFDVIDVDPPAGSMTYHRMLNDGGLGATSAHGRVTTASGGIHLYVAPDGSGNAAGIFPGIDYRGAGGYVVAPPSTLGIRGRAWSWAVKPSPRITGTAEVTG